LLFNYTYDECFIIGGMNKMKYENKDGIGKECPKCRKGTIVLRSSIYGKFGGCSNFPKCRFTIKLQ